jgi:hypothetical protein
MMMIFHGIVSIFYLINVRITVEAFRSVSSSRRIPALTTSFFLPNPNTHHHHHHHHYPCCGDGYKLRSRRNPNFGVKSTTLSSSFTIHDDTLHIALKKPSKTLSIILDCHLGQHDNNNNKEEEEDTNNMEQIVSLLSMQLRKVQACALHTSDVRIAEVLVSEQLTAKGNFPGPCPILYSGSHYDEAIRVGVTGIIGTYDELSSLSSSTIQKIYKVSSPKDVMTVLENSEGNTTPNQNNNYFCVNGTLDTIQDVMNAIKSSGSFVVIASLPSMQEENQEIRLGKELQALGVMSILMEGSCVGDNEDIEYASFVINGLTKKRSSKFNMSGLTGSTNGHFGGIASSTTTTWLRTKR